MEITDYPFTFRNFGFFRFAAAEAWREELAKIAPALFLLMLSFFAIFDWTDLKLIRPPFVIVYTSSYAISIGVTALPGPLAKVAEAMKSHPDSGAAIATEVALIALA